MDKGGGRAFYWLPAPLSLDPCWGNGQAMFTIMMTICIICAACFVRIAVLVNLLVNHVECHDLDKLCIECKANAARHG